MGGEWWTGWSIFAPKVNINCCFYPNSGSNCNVPNMNSTEWCLACRECPSSGSLCDAAIRESQPLSIRLHQWDLQLLLRGKVIQEQKFPFLWAEAKMWSENKSIPFSPKDMILGKLAKPSAQNSFSTEIPDAIISNVSMMVFHIVLWLWHLSTWISLKGLHKQKIGLDFSGIGFA